MKIIKPTLLIFLLTSFLSHGKELKSQKKLKDSERSMSEVLEAKTSINNLHLLFHTSRFRNQHNAFHL